MANLEIPRQVAELVLLGPRSDRRQLQDSPILGDVWLAFSHEPAKPQDLLIEPHWQRPAGKVAVELDRRLGDKAEGTAEIAPLHGIVAARLGFADLLRCVVPLSSWWHQERIRRDVALFAPAKSEAGRDADAAVATEASERVERAAAERDRRISQIVRAVRAYAGNTSPAERLLELDDLMRPFDRYLGLTALILWAAETNATSVSEVSEAALRKQIDLIGGELAVPGDKDEPLVWQVSLNRIAGPALTHSVASVKADAARRLFSIDCSNITWAIVDSGINGAHPAFLNRDGNETRVVRAFDFTRIREIVRLDNIRPGPARDARLRELLHDDLLERPTDQEALELMQELARDAGKGRAVHWELVQPFVEIRPSTMPRSSDHGTHVAGILGASRAGAEARQPESGEGIEFVDGLCPDINLMDFRVLGTDRRKTEFAIIAALQFIRYLNDQTDYMQVHGANLSVSIPHEVRNYACGKTPICLECERLVESGVLVVAAAGNRGYQNFQTTDGPYEGYAAFSVTDPGNADGVVTVGSTHRSAPHTYGVSFFSSRGPTGDGRPKPDLVAPGERIRAPFRRGLGDLDGTSMAAPHVSGAAAMLMARYVELIGEPRRVKRILCDSATDLGRERSFQGAGMLDVLRALQSI